MSDSKYSDIGSNISDIVQEAIESQDFSRLSDAIRESVNSTVSSAFSERGVTDAINGMADGLNTVGDTFETLSRILEKTRNKDRRPDYMKDPRHEKQAAQNPWKGNGQFEKKTSDHMYGKDVAVDGLYSPGEKTRLSGYIQFIAGLAGGLGCLGALLVLCVLGSVIGRSMLAGKIVLGILTLVFAFFGWKGNKILKRFKRFRTFIRAIGEKTWITVRDLAGATGKSEKDTLREVREMLEEGMFLQGHLDEASGSLFVTDDSYEAFKNCNRQMEEMKVRAAEDKARAEKEREALPEEVKKLLKDGDGYIDQIRRSNDAISDEEVTAKLNGLEAVTRKIFEYVEDHPESASETKKLMRYYLPTTIKLLDSYEKLTAELEENQHPEQAKNIERSRKEIEETLDTLNVAFAKLFDNLYQDTSIDIASDISVLNTMLAKEGLKEEEIGQVMQGVQ